LPRRLEPTFAHAAPDFWSIRSLSVTLDVAPPRDTAPPPLDAGPTPLARRDPAREHESAEIRAEIEAPPAPLAHHPQHPPPRPALGRRPLHAAARPGSTNPRRSEPRSKLRAPAWQSTLRTRPRSRRSSSGSIVGPSTSLRGER